MTQKVLIRKNRWERQHEKPCSIAEAIEIELSSFDPDGETLSRVASDTDSLKRFAGQLTEMLFANKLLTKEQVLELAGSWRWEFMDTAEGK